jgi:hypothetical protein
MTRLPLRIVRQLLLPMLPVLWGLVLGGCEDIPTGASRGSIELASKPSGGIP